MGGIIEGCFGYFGKMRKCFLIRVIFRVMFLVVFIFRLCNCVMGSFSSFSLDVDPAGLWTFVCCYGGNVEERKVREEFVLSNFASLKECGSSELRRWGLLCKGSVFDKIVMMLDKQTAVKVECSDFKSFYYACKGLGVVIEGGECK
jgi:hypothetical protein